MKLILYLNYKKEIEKIIVKKLALGMILAIEEKRLIIFNGDLIYPWVEELIFLYDYGVTKPTKNPNYMLKGRFLRELPF